jgi:hypothetical protein
MPILRRRGHTKRKRGRKLRRLLQLGAIAAAVAAYRNSKLAANERRYGPGSTPGR